MIRRSALAALVTLASLSPAAAAAAAAQPGPQVMSAYALATPTAQTPSVFSSPGRWSLRASPALACG